jgi:effector-binding domain-containing protein
MHPEYKVRERPRMSVFAKALDVRLASIGATISSSFAEIYGHLASRGVAATQPPFVIYEGQPDSSNAPFPIEVCAPVGDDVEAPVGWSRLELPAGAFASVVHVGPYERLGDAYAGLQAWVGRQGLAIAGPPREVYLSEPTVAPAETRTVVEFPVREAAGAPPVVA